jgi:hypothetical protein
MACLLWLGKICNRPLDGIQQFLPLGFFSIDAITGASNWLWLLLIDHVTSLKLKTFLPRYSARRGQRIQITTNHY